MAIRIVRRVSFPDTNSAVFFRISNEENGQKLCKSNNVFSLTEDSVACSQVPWKNGVLRQVTMNLALYCQDMFYILMAYKWDSASMQKAGIWPADHVKF